MKVLAVFSAVLAVATCSPVVKTWTHTQLLNAQKDGTNGDPAMKPYIDDALYVIAHALFHGVNATFFQKRSPSGEDTWTVDELKKAIEDPDTKPEYRPSLLDAYRSVIHRAEQTGKMQESVAVAILAMDISTWTESDLNEALKSSSTKADLIPYLEKARTDLNQALEKGEKRETITIVTPIELIVPVQTSKS